MVKISGSEYTVVDSSLWGGNRIVSDALGNLFYNPCGSVIPSVKIQLLLVVSVESSSNLMIGDPTWRDKFVGKVDCIKCLGAVLSGIARSGKVYIYKNSVCRH